MSSIEILETTPNTEITTAGDAEISSHEDHAGHDHAAHDHSGHHHHHDVPALNPECTREVTIDVPADEVTKQFRKVTKRYQKMARIPGFRAGKVPDSLIRSRFAEQIRQDVVEEILPSHFRTAIDQQNLKPVSQPQVTDIQLAEGQPLHFKAIFEILPDFSIDGYQSVTVAKPETELTDAEFENELSRVLDSRATMEPVLEDRAIASGDFAEIDFRGEAADAESPETDEATSSADPIQGNGVLVEVGGANTLPAFNEALVGSKPGQELKFEVTYPPDFNEKRLAGKTIAYQIEVKGVKRKLLPELDDDFAKELGGFESIDAFKSTLREQAGEEKRRQLENVAKDALVNALVERFEFAVPESMVQQQVDARLDRGLRALASQGMKPGGHAQAGLRPAARSGSAIRRLAEVKGQYPSRSSIADAEHTEVSDDELEEQLAT